MYQNIGLDDREMMYPFTCVGSFIHLGNKSMGCLSHKSCCLIHLLKTNLKNYDTKVKGQRDRGPQKP